MTTKNSVLIGILLDVSSSMRTNWKNQTGKHAPRFDIIKDALNEQIWKLAALQDATHGETEIFCLGMGLCRTVSYARIDSEDEERLIDEIPNNFTESNLVCDLLALSELIPTESIRVALEKSLNDKWNIYADNMLREIRRQSSDNIEQQLDALIQEGIDHSARRHLYRSWRYRLLKYLERITLTQKWALLSQISRRLSNYADTWEAKIEIACLSESNKFINGIRSEVQQLFEAKKAEYAEVIKEMLQDFASRQIQIILELLTAGHTAQHTLDYFDEETARSIAKEIYKHLHHEVDERLRTPIVKDWGKFLGGLKFGLHASLDRDRLRALTEKYVQKYAWDALEPFVQKTVFDIINDGFSEVAKKMILYWVSTSAKREVIQPIRDFRGILPNGVGEETLHDKYLFGTTPIREALSLASMRLLSSRYEGYDKFLVIVSDGEFDPNHSAQSLITSVEVLVDLLKKSGVTVISLCVAKRNVVNRLVSRISPQLPNGVKTMFSISSKVEEHPKLAEWLHQRNSDLALDSKLFLQINESSLLHQVFDAIFTYTAS